MGKLDPNIPSVLMRSALEYPLDGLRIMIAEDNHLNQMIIEGFLEVAGAKVHIAHNGREALSLVHSNVYDAILMDVQMPEMDGLHATREIRKIPSLQHTPILALTAAASKDEINACLENGMNDVVAKPIDAEDLFRKIYDCIHLKKATAFHV
jgi:CheY-like chemotaxis protein